MSKLFNDLQEGLQQAIEFERGNANATVTTYVITPVRKYERSEIKTLRQNAGMTQTVFAGFMGVSKKTVEAWENGRIRPSGSACRLLDILSSNQELALPFMKKITL